MGKGFPARYPEDVVRADALRTPVIPWIQCDGKIDKGLQNLCVIGDTNVQPDLLLWGDSHMLAWGPGFDSALKSLGRSAYFAPNSACPPILDVDQSTRPLCRSQNDAIAQAITGGGSGDGKVSTVVLAALWPSYFNDDKVALSSEGLTGGNLKVASPMLIRTLDRLADAGVEPVLMGPVPEYPVSVPLAVALGSTDGMHLHYTDMQSTNEYKALSKLPGFVDVAQWFCTDECSVRDEDGVFYRDSNHLSIHGAHKFQGHLTQMLSAAPEARGAP